MARCPAHEDQTASLKVDVGRDGRILVHCHAGCTYEAVLAAARVESADLRGEENKGGSTPPITRAHLHTLHTPRDPGCTLQAYSQKTRLPVEFLSEVGV